jgi:flagellar M-ring protein FliF
VKSLAFQSVSPLGTAASGGLFAGLVDPMAALQIAVLALVALALGLFVVRPILLSSRRGLPALAAPDSEEDEDFVPQMNMALPEALTGEIDDGGDAFPGALSLMSPDADGLPALSDDPNDPVGRLRRLIEERQDETLEILKSWVEDRQEAKS